LLKADLETVGKAADIVKKGGVVAYPTDTVYGLGCDPTKPDAVRRLIQIKGERKKPLPILGDAIESLEKVAILTYEAGLLAKKFWPGALTIILTKKPFLPDIIAMGSSSLGVRIPNHKIALQLIGLSGGLLVGTSANLSGSKPPIDAEGVAKQIGNKVDLILDGGRTPLAKESTVISLIGGKLRVIRVGPVSESDIKSALTQRLEKTRLQG